jgi:hypothetical protein
LAGILVGMERGTPPQLQQDFNATGTTHIIAISGLNTTILAPLFTSTFGRWLLQDGGSQGPVLIRDRGGAWPIGRAFGLKALRPRLSDPRGICWSLPIPLFPIPPNVSPTLADTPNLATSQEPIKRSLVSDSSHKCRFILLAMRDHEALEPLLSDLIHTAHDSKLNLSLESTSHQYLLELEASHRDH